MAAVGGAVAAVVLSVSGATADPLGQIMEFSNGLQASNASRPHDIVAGPDGNLWFTDTGTTHAIGRITPSGQINEYTDGLQADNLSRPTNIATGPDGNLWFTDLGGSVGGGINEIGRITPSGQINEYSQNLNPGSHLDDIAPGPDGNVWFTDNGTTQAIGKITPSGQIIEYDLPGTDTAKDIAPGPDGNMWFTDYGNGAIGKITPSGQVNEYSMNLQTGTDPHEIAPGPDGNMWFTDRGPTKEIGKITMGGQITEYNMGLQTGNASSPFDIAPGADGNMWFTDQGTTREIGQITPGGHITEYDMGLQTGNASDPFDIGPGPDGNLWFTDDGTTEAIGRIGAGAPAALQATPSLAGAGQQGSPETCTGHWATWAGVSASTSLYPFDGYQWLRDATVIPGQIGPTYSPTPADVGHQLTCRITVTYPRPFLVSANATSAAIVVTSAPVIVPMLASLSVSPRGFSLAGREVKGKCVKQTSRNRGDKRCAPPIKLTLSYTLNVPVTVTFTIKSEVIGRLMNGKCVKQTNKNKHNRKCTRLVPVHGSVVTSGTQGANSFTFKGKIGGHRLGPGTYQLTATPNGGTPQTVTFKLIG